MRRFALASAFVAILTTASCDSETIGGTDGEPNVTSMRISTGTQTVTINANGTVTGGPLNLPANSSTAITATFLTSDNVPDPNVTQVSFQLNVSSSGAVTFQRSNVNPFAGTLNTSGSGSSSVSFSLYNLEEQRNIFGPFSVSVVAG